MRLILCGDLVPTAVTSPAFDAGDVVALMGDALGVIARGDFAIANLECALTDSENKIRKCGPNLKGKPAYANVIRACGFTHMGLSNNHVMDFGVQGMRDTVSAVNAAGLISFGFGENDQASRKPLYLEKDNERAAVLGVCEHEYCYALSDQFGANPFDPFDTMEDIAEAKKRADFVVVIYHGGKEQCEYPSPRLRKACRAMVRAGADLVVCQHSHCVGCHERYLRGDIVYGEGNFNFVANGEHPHWKSGLMIETEFGKETKLDFLPLVVTDTGITLAKGEEHDAILRGFYARSAILNDEGAWLKAWEDFCRAQDYYIKAASDAFIDAPEGELCKQVFPHYLDCEAHLDVWKTLFKTWHAEKRSGA